MKTCENCGGIRKSGRKYCSYCRNRRIKPKEIELSDEEIEYEAKQRAYEQTKTGKVGLWIIKMKEILTQKDGITKSLYHVK